MWLQKVGRATMIGAVLFATWSIVGCDEPGRVRARRSQLVGVYEIKLDSGVERLELNNDGTYSQDVISGSHPLHHVGQWRMNNHFLGASDVVLADAAVTEEDEKDPLGFGELTLNVHDHAGKLALARNPVADWFYERIR